MRQFNHEFAALPDRTVDLSIAAMRARQMLYDGQPQTRAAQLAGTCFIHAIEALKHARQMLSRNTNAHVAHANDSLFVFDAGADNDFAFSCGRKASLY